MSKGVKKVLGFVVAVAIPFVALPLAGMLAASTGIAALGGWAGAAAVGAGLGAANAALTGGNVGQGALLGGIGGGLAGAAGGASAFAGAPTAGTAGAAGTAGVAGAPAAGTNPLVAGARDMAVKAGGTLAPTAEKALTFMEAVGQIPGTLATQLTDPVKLAELTLKAGSMLASGMMTSDPMAGIPEEERQLVEMRMREMEATSRTNQELYQRQLTAATDLMNEAKAINPQYAAQQAAMNQQLRGAALTKDATETYSKGPGQTGREAALKSAERGIALGVGRNMGTTSTQAYNEAKAARERGIATAAGLLPVSAPQGPYGSMLDLYGKYSNQSRNDQIGIQQSLGDITATLFPPRAKPRPQAGLARRTDSPSSIVTQGR